MEPLSEDEKRWRAEQDAHTLAEAQVISKDQDRLTAAQQEAERVAKSAEERAQAYKNVSRKGQAKRQGTRSPSRPAPTTRAQQRTAIPSSGGELAPGIPAPTRKSTLF
jgi:hypothetical protein